MHGFYRIGEKSQEVIVENSGLWTESEHFQNPKLNENQFSRRKNFRGYPLVGVGVNVRLQS